MNKADPLIPLIEATIDALEAGKVERVDRMPETYSGSKSPSPDLEASDESDEEGGQSQISIV